MTVYTTLNKISAFVTHKSLDKLLSSLGKAQADDEPLALVSILESNGLRDALWCIRTVFDQHREKIIQFAILYAENALLIFEKEFPNEKRPRLAIQAAKDYLAGKITKADLEAAADAANKATYAKQGENAAWVVVYATYAAAHAIYWWDAALGTVLQAAWDASWVDAEKKFQENLFREIFG